MFAYNYINIKILNLIFSSYFRLFIITKHRKIVKKLIVFENISRFAIENHVK